MYSLTICVFYFTHLLYSFTHRHVALFFQDQKDQSYSTVKTAATRISVNNLKPGTTYVFLIRTCSSPALSSLSSSPLSSSSSSSSPSSPSAASSSTPVVVVSPPPLDYGAYSTPLELQTLGECKSMDMSVRRQHC